MSEEPDPESPGNDEVRLLLRDDTLSRIASWLGNAYPDASSHVQDAVVDAVVKYLAKRQAGVAIENSTGWIRVVAKNFVLNKLEREINRETTDEGLSSLASSDGNGPLEARQTYEYVKGLVEQWESRRMRVVTLLFLEAGYEGETLSHMEAAKYASEILGEDVPWTSIGRTRSRGFTRLRAEILRIAEGTGFDPITGMETATA